MPYFINPDFIIILISPIICAFIGWLTNKIAVRMLFHPRSPRRFFWYSWQGLVPRRRAEIAEQVAEIVEQELVSRNDITRALNHPLLRKRIRYLIEDELDGLIERNLGFIPLLPQVFRVSFISKLKNSIVLRLSLRAPQIVKSVVAHLEEELNLKEIVKKKIDTFDTDKLEQLVNRVASRELRSIEVLGGVIGFLIGLVQSIGQFFSLYY